MFSSSEMKPSLVVLMQYSQLFACFVIRRAFAVRVTLLLHVMRVEAWKVVWRNKEKVLSQEEMLFDYERANL